jgi:alanine-glyoxylate transaminase / serine-glyoxylate transaminase / serine-pyruvate transaminase
VTFHAGRQFLQIPGPSNLPDRVQRALARPLIDHRGPEFAALAISAVNGLKTVFRTDGDVALYPGSGTGAWEAALVNTLSPGDQVLGFVQGHFAATWHELARRLSLEVDVLECSPRRAPDADQLHERLRADDRHVIKAILLVHNETSTGVCADVPAVRAAIDEAHHPALLLVDAVSSLACAEYEHQRWGVDVTVAASQKGFMLPPGLSFNAVSSKAIEVGRSATLPRSYWSWEPQLDVARTGWFPYTPPTTLLFGLSEALALLFEEGLDQVFERHRRHSAMTREAIRAWGFETYCDDDRNASVTVTAMFMPPEMDADRIREFARDELDLVLGIGLGDLRDRVLRIGHLGALNDLMLLGTLAGLELGLRTMGFSTGGGVDAALELATSARTAV